MDDKELTLNVRFYRDEMRQQRVICVSEEFIPLFTEGLRLLSGDWKVEFQEIKPWGSILDFCRLRETITAVFEVQGLKHREGESVVMAIESLVAKYAAAK